MKIMEKLSGELIISGDFDFKVSVTDNDPSNPLSILKIYCQCLECQ